MGTEILSPMSPRQVFFPREERSSTTRLSTSTSTGKTATASRTLKVARWVADFEADKKKAGDEYNSISTTVVETNTVKDTEVGTNETDEIETTTKETEIETTTKETEIEIVTKETEVEETNDTTVEINKSGTESVQRRNPPTPNRQAGLNSVESVVMEDEEERVTIDLETEDKETTTADNSREKESTTGDCQVSKSNQTKEANQTELVIKPKPQTELGEYVESDSEPEVEIKSEEDEYQERPIDETTEVKDISLKEEIKIEKKDEDLKLKIEVGDTRFQRQEIVAWPKTIDSDECNNDDEDTLPWSPLPDLMYEEISSGNDIITSTVPWIDVIPRNNPNMANSVDERSLFGSESEKEGDSTDVRIQFKTAYVAIKKLKLPGLRFPMKTSKKKRKRKVRPKAKWVINPTSKDSDWTPLPARPARRVPAKI